MKINYQVNNRIFYIIWFVFFIFWVYKATTTPSNDLGNYYYGALAMVEHQFNNAIYFPEKFVKFIYLVTGKITFLAYAPNSPTLALLFIPSLLFNIKLFKIMMTLIDITILIYFIFDFKKRLSNFKITLMLFIFFIPILNNFILGQIYIVLLFLLFQFYKNLQKSNYIAASISLSLSILLKTFPIIFIVYLLYKKEYKLIIVTILFCLVGILVTLVWVDESVWKFYFLDILSLYNKGRVSDELVFGYQTLYMFLKTLYIGRNDILVLFHHYSISMIEVFIISFKIFLFLGGYYIHKHLKQNILKFIYWIFVIQLISPYNSTYSFVLLILILGYIDEFNFSKKWIIYLFLFLICTLPVKLYYFENFPYLYLRLFLLMALFMMLYLKTIKELTIYKYLCYSFIIGIIFSIKLSNKELYTFKKIKNNLPILITNFEIRKNYIVYEYWNDKGNNKDSFLSEFKVGCHELDPNFKTKLQQEVSKVNIKKIVPLDTNQALVLCDFKRGIGFYNIYLVTTSKKNVTLQNKRKDSSNGL